MKTTFNVRENGQLEFEGSTVLKTYIRNQKNRKIGLVVAFPIDESVRFGYCVANVKKGDKFNVLMAEDICLGRALAHADIRYPFNTYLSNNKLVVIPKNAQKYLRCLFYRARDYFKYLPDNGELPNNEQIEDIEK